MTRVLARTLSIKEQAEDKGEVGVEDSERCHSRMPVHIFFHTPFTILLHDSFLTVFVLHQY